MNIVNYIPIGQENAITREALSIRTGLTDRAIRELIAQARRDTAIINNQDGKGYYRPSGQEEIERYIKQESARAKSIFWCLRGAKKALKEVENGNAERLCKNT